MITMTDISTYTNKAVDQFSAGAKEASDHIVAFHEKQVEQANKLLNDAKASRAHSKACVEVIGAAIKTHLQTASGKIDEAVQDFTDGVRDGVTEAMGNEAKAVSTEDLHGMINKLSAASRSSVCPRCIKDFFKFSSGIYAAEIARRKTH